MQKRRLASTGISQVAPVAWQRGLAGVLFGLVCCMSGCGSGGDEGPGPVRPEPPLGAPAPLPGAPAPTAAAVCGDADLSGLASLVYVSTSGTDDPACGKTTATACKSIQQGIDACTASGCGVLVRHGLYETSATITLRDAVSVYGGCLFDGETGRRYRSIVQASPAPGTPAVSAEGINTATNFYGIVVVGKNETAAGTASLTMTVTDSKGLALSQTVLVSGTGGDGANGGTAAATGGYNGVDGDFGDQLNFTGGAGAGGPACNGSATASGGTGADYRIVGTTGTCVFSCPCSQSGGAWGASGGDSGNVKGGGGGGPGSNGARCDGQVGGQSAGQGGFGGTGAPGACAQPAGVVAANAWGSLGPTAWLPVTGGAGTAGDTGSGGGGGGAGGVCIHFALWDGNSLSFHGMAGGGGGGGGCGGPGGQGGQQGGASIPLVLSGSALIGNGALSLVPGPAGNGGHAGAGGTGGPGGKGGNSPFSHTVPPMTSCVYWNGQTAGFGGDGGRGGDGGQGGAGSGGAGGNGGASIGLAMRAASTAPAAAVVYPPQRGGAGGSGGAGGQNAPIPVVDPSPCKGAVGQDGLQGGSAPVIDFDLPLASMLFAGQQLPKFHSISSSNGSVLLAMQNDDNLCLYASGSPSWCSETNGEQIPAALMQTDGNFCMYSPSGSVWCSGTAGHPDAYLIVQDSGHLQIIEGDTVLWSKP